MNLKMVKAMRKYILIGLFVLIASLMVVKPAKTQDCGTITTLKDPTGTIEINEFLPSESIYAKGSGMWPNARYRIYIIKDTTIYIGMAIPAPVVATVDVTTDGSGRFSAELIWPAPTTPGRYDIIADCLDYGQVGVYDCADAIDDEEILVTAGFFVIPETSLGTIAVILAGSTAILSKRKRIS